VAASVALWQLNTTRARGLVAASRASEDIDPEISVLTAAHGVAATSRWDRGHLPDSEQQLHRAILTSGLRLGTYGRQRRKLRRLDPDGNDGYCKCGPHNKIWDAFSGQELFALAGTRARFAASPGVRMASGSRPGVRIKLQKYGCRDGQKRTDAKSVITIQLTASMGARPGGWRQGVGHDTAIVWQRKAAKPLLTLRGTVRVLSVAWSPNGKWLARQCRPGSEVWDSASGNERATLGRPPLV